METEEYVALGGLITIIASSLALVIKQIESSRCTDIDCCGLTCKRRVEQVEEQARMHPDQCWGALARASVRVGARVARNTGHKARNGTGDQPMSVVVVLLSDCAVLIRRH